MSRYSCRLAEEIGRKYSLSPEQMRPGMLRTLARTWRPGGRDLARELNTAAGRLERKLRRLGLPEGTPSGCDEDGREMARRAMAGNPATAALLAEMERSWTRRDLKEGT